MWHKRVAIMSSINLNFAKVVIIVMIRLQAELFVGVSCCIEKERQALLKMKEAFVDDSGLLSSWSSSSDCCQWSGVLCNTHTGHVWMLNLTGDSNIGQKLRGEISPSLVELQNLSHLIISYNNFSGSDGIPKFFGSLTKLRYLDLYFSEFGGKIPVELGQLSDLRILNLTLNRIVGSIPLHLANLSSLQELHLDRNDLVGNIPSQLGNLTSLEVLSLGYNADLKIDDKSPVGIEWISNLSSLTSLDLSSVSNLNYSSNFLPTIGKLPNLKDLSLENCSLTDINILSTPPSHLNFSTSLISLDLGENKLTSSIFPWLFNLSSNLAYLYLDQNHLAGPIPNDFGKNMNSLVALDLSYNELNGTISDIHFSNLTKLQSLDLSHNLLSLKFSNNWVPPFQSQFLWLPHCKLGPGFPRWLRTQNNLRFLSVSYAEINDSIPEWFWRFVQGIDYLEIKHSNLKGTIPNLSLDFTRSVISLASNQIEGSVPPFLLKSGSLDISENKISRFVLSCDKGISAIVENLVALNLSTNNLSGELLGCWDHFKSLEVLDLSNNQLSGRIPNSMGSSSQLEQLVLRNNCFSGQLPSLENATQLAMIDLEMNNLSGPIPASWTRDNIKELQTLSLRMNNLDGNLPCHLCYLTKLRVLDLSFNEFTGPIPSCVDNLVAMAQKSDIDDSMRYISFYNKKGGFIEARWFEWDLYLVWKGTEQEYTDHYGLINIDLSHNQLTGEIPVEIGKLAELKHLNLSENKLSGNIISEIGQLKSLEALDLSRNHFHGEIPSSLVQIYWLSSLDLSNNNLSGEIPTGTQLQSFEASSYEGNAYLCGRPLDRLCSSEDDPLGNATQADDHAGDEDDPFMKGFYESLGVGFAIGFWMVFGSLLVIRSWRHAYFNFVSKLSDSIYVATELHVARWRRWLRN